MDVEAAGGQSVVPYGSTFNEEGQSVRTKEDTEYRCHPYGWRVVIPKGTPVSRATNLPDDDNPTYWVEPWEGMTGQELSWLGNYGFLLESFEVGEDEHD